MVDKKYLICLHTIPEYEELEVKAKNKREARKKAEAIIEGNSYVYYDMEIDNIEEIK